MWRQSLAEKKAYRLPKRFLLIKLLRSRHAPLLFRCLVPIMRRIAVDGKAGSGDEARFFRREVRDEAGDLRYVTIRFKGMSVLTNSACAELISVAVGPG